MTEGALHEYKERSGACVDCGNSPVNHLEHYISSVLFVWTARALVERHGLHSLLVRGTGALFDIFEQSLQRSIAAMPFASFSRDVTKANTYRSQVIWEEAQRRGIEMEQLCIFGKGTEIYRARLNDAWFYFQSLPMPREKRGAGVGWVDDKLLLKNALERAGIPAPQSASVTALPGALEAFERMASPVVIKPRSGSRGRHTTVHVRTRAQAEAAFRIAQKLSHYIVVERYLEGPVCRGTVVDGKLAGFFRADPPRVTGDGVSTIGQLIEIQNATRRERVQPIVLSDEHRRFLARRDLTEESVLPQGASVPLTHRTGRLFGGTTHELLGEEHPKLRAYLESAARALGIGIVGFDLVVPDPQRDPDEQQWGIIEANTLPYIDLHYLALDGAPSNVAAAVWDLALGAMHTPVVDSHGAHATIGA